MRHIVLTHLDVDLVGGLEDFPDAKVHLSAAELDAARRPLTAQERFRYHAAQWAHGPDWVPHSAAGDTWFGFSAVRGLPGLPPSILLVPLAGHTRGHLGVAIDTGREGDDGSRRRLVHAGDAWRPRQVTSQAHQGSQGRSRRRPRPALHYLALVQDWEETAFEHGHAFLTTPPHELLPDLAADLVSLLTSIRTISEGATRNDLCGPAGKLAALMAMTVSTLGERRHARDWWKTARHAADASRDQDLQVWVRGYEAMNSLYSRRPLSVVLRLADQAIAIGGRAAGAAALEAMASRAQAPAMMGRQQDADEALRPSRTSPRRRSAAVPPQMRRQRAQSELLRATSLVRAGDVTAGVDEALAAVQRTTTIQRGARMVLEAVPDADLTTPAVRDYRDAFALPAPEEE